MKDAVLESAIASCLDPVAQNELYTVTYPIFVHCFMELFHKGDENAGLLCLSFVMAKLTLCIP